MYFRLVPDCFLVPGNRWAAVYDLRHGRLFLADGRAADLLAHCERGEAVDDFPPDSPEGKLLRWLVAEGLGDFLPTRHFVERLQLYSPIRFQGIAADAPNFSRLSFQITDKCGLTCEVCGAEGNKALWQPCATCLMRVPVGDRGSYEEDDLDRLIDDLRRMEFKTLHLRGGNPLYEDGLLLRLIERVHARYPNLNLLVTTPGQGRLADLASWACLRFNVVLLGASADDYERVGGAGAAWEEVVANVDTLKAAGFAESGRLTVTIQLTLATRHRSREIASFVRHRWAIDPGVAEAYPYPVPGDEHPRFSHVGPRTKPITPFRDVGEFFFRAYNNTCLHGAVDLGLDGLFRPCHWAGEAFGCWPSDTLRTAMAKPQPYYYWELTKEGIEACRRCALRYACADCTVAELDGEALRGIREMYCPLDPGGDMNDGVVPSVSAPDGYVQVLTLGNGGGDRA